MAGKLIRAAARGDPPGFIAYLIEREGCDVNERDENGYDALMLAAYFGHLDVVETLLRYGADVRARASNGTTALMAAVQNGHAGVARLLVEHGADVNAVDQAGLPPLMTAAWRGDAELVGFLIARGADVNFRNARGWTALGVARQKGHAEVAELLRRAGAVAEEDLFAAAKEGDLQRLASLLELGLDPNARDRSGATPLIWAALHGHLDVVRYLIDRGARVNEADACGWTALMSAVAMDRLEIAELLLAHGADPNTVCHDKWAAVVLDPELIMNPESLRLWDPEALAGTGHPCVEEYRTPLMKAAEEGNAAMVELLLRHGADPNARTPEGETAADLARRKGHGHIVRMLE